MQETKQNKTKQCNKQSLTHRTIYGGESISSPMESRFENVTCIFRYLESLGGISFSIHFVLCSAMASIQNFDSNEQSLPHKIGFLMIKAYAIRTKDSQSSVKSLTQASVSCKGRRMPFNSAFVMWIMLIVSNKADW